MAPGPRGLGLQALSPCSPFRTQEETHRAVREAVEKFSSKVGVLSSAQVPGLSRLGLRALKGLLEVILSCPNPPAEGGSPHAGCPAAMGRSVTGEAVFPRRWGHPPLTSLCLALPVAQSPSALGQWGSEWAWPWGWRGVRVPRCQPSRPHDAPGVLQGDKHCAQMKGWLQEEKRYNEVVPKGPGEIGWVPTGPAGLGGLEEGRGGLRDSDPSFSQVLRQEIGQLDEAVEQEEIR